MNLALVAVFLAVLLLVWPVGKRRARDALDEIVSRVGVEWSHRRLAEGVIWVGGIGSGKTSCSAPMLVDMLRAGYGAVLYSVKVEERKHLEKLIKLAERDDVIRIGRDHPENTIDAVAYTWAATASIEDIAQLFEGMITAIEGKGDAKSDSKSRFFERSGLFAVRNSALLLIAADPQFLSFGSITQMIVGGPTLPYINNPVTGEEVRRVADFRKTKFFEVAAVASQNLADGKVAPELKKDVENAIDYWFEEWAQLPKDTRGSICASVTAMSKLFSYNPLRSLVAEKTTIRPEMLWEGEGKIFLFTDAVHKGVDCKLLQLTWKFLIQKAAERRDASGKHIKVVQWQDEAPQLMLTAAKIDSSFQNISRSKGFIQVLHCQSLAQFREHLGNEDEASDYLASIRNKIVMATDEQFTTRYLSDLIGKEVKILPSPDHHHPQQPGVDWWGSEANSPQWHSTMDYTIAPHEWGSLQKAKPGQDGEAVIYLGGSPINGRTWELVRLKQLLN